jgi:hypothetical protein
MSRLHIPTTSPDGFQVTFVSSEKEGKELVEKYPVYVKWLTDSGFQPRKAGSYGRKDTRPKYDVNADIKCKTCDQKMTPRQGTSRSGKPWYGYFCANKDHEPIWAK